MLGTEVSFHSCLSDYFNHHLSIKSNYLNFEKLSVLCLSDFWPGRGSVQ